jgi:cytoplasmic iron level regulating protein YaaA (DUF328/UPF0246 family)
MKIILSPSKRLNFNKKIISKKFTQPHFGEEAKQLVENLRQYSPARLQKLMDVNPKIAQENFERFQQWAWPFTPGNAQQAMFVFMGDVYNGLKAETLSMKAINYAQEHLYILSGLYGILHPLDLIQPYRLEMGTALKMGKKKNLYEFWDNKIANYIKKEMDAKNENVLINLASNEYFNVIDNGILKAKIITPNFLDYKNGKYRFLTVFGKKARGMMARFILEKQIEDPQEIKLFDSDGYYYNDNLSEGDNWVFTRG